MEECKYTYRSDPSAGLAATLSGDVVYCTTHHKYGGCDPIVATIDREIDTVERLRMGGPNALEVADEAAAEIELLRRLLGESARREGAANAHVTRLQHRIEQLSLDS